MKKQLSTAMAAAMAFGTVVPAFTSEVNAATSVNTVDLSDALTYLDASGNALSESEIEANGVPVLTRAEVYNYNGANADDRAAHTLKPQFADAKILFEKQNAQDASQDLFVMVKISDSKLTIAQAQKALVDAKITKAKADGNTVVKFTADDFKISVSRDTNNNITGYKFANKYLNNLAVKNSADGEVARNIATSETAQAEIDAETALAKEFVNNGVNVSTDGTLTVNGVVQAKNTQTTSSVDINAIQSQIKTLQAQKTNLDTKIENASDAIANLDEAKYKDIVTSATVKTGGVTTNDTSEITQTITQANALETYVKGLDVNTLKNATNYTVSISTGSTTSGKTVANIDLFGIKYQLYRASDSTAQTSIGTAYTTAQTALSSARTILTNTKASLTTDRDAIVKQIDALNTQLQEVPVATIEESVNVVLNTVNKVINETLNGALRTVKDTNAATNGAGFKAEELKKEILNIQIGTIATTSATPKEYKYYTTDTNGNIVINKDAIIEYNTQKASTATAATVLTAKDELTSTLAKFFGITSTTSDLKTISNRDTLYNQLVSYNSDIDANKSYVEGRTVYVNFDTSSKFVETFEYRESLLVADNSVESLRKEIIKGLSGLNNSNVTLGSDFVTVNFNTAGVDAKTDRQVYEATNKVKYALENLIAEKKVVAVKTETGNSNQHTVVSVYVANTDGTADTTQKVITLTFNNTIEARVKVAGQPSVVDIPAIENTDFANITWAKNEIVDAMLAGYIDTTTEFRPKDSITRGEFAKIVCTVFGIDTRDEAVKNLVNPFQDVKEGDWYYKYVVALYNEGNKGTIINGFQDGTFQPKGNITRQQAAKMIAAAYDLKIEALNTVGDNAVSAEKDGVVEKVVAVNGQTIHVDSVTKFTDDKEIASWADESVTALVKENVINGYEDGTFKPDAEINRVEALYMLVKANKQVNADDSDIQ